VNSARWLPRLAPWLIVAALLTACAAAPQGSVVLLPEVDGRPTAVTVTQDGKETVLDQPYAATRLTSKGPQKFESNAAQVQAQFGPTLAALPSRPAKFTLYFVEGKDEFTEASKKDIDGLFAEIANRPVPDVVVIGHTDKVGSDALNDPLSRQRAEVVRKALIARGVAPQNIVAIGRGKREPIVATADGVAEPRNRRVEILVR
jgi:outer membrane protein OmpA-like peptidoglycan-associated protein